MSKYAESENYAAIALDPIHIGAGGYRLGRADNTIVRDPATDVPKVPGTSLAGVIREYTTLHLMETDNDCKTKPDGEEKRICAEKKVIKWFGDEKRQGRLRFYDAQIIFFPVSSIQGTVWITTKKILEYWLKDVTDNNGNKLKIPDKIEDKAYAVKGIDIPKPLNLGWLMPELESVSGGEDVILPSDIDRFVGKVVITSDKLFSQVINDNLEVRTSVRIDPTTGTAAKGALFTYEAIPRGTVLGCEIAIDKRGEGTNSIKELIRNTFPYLKLLGIGGMGTRGFGRIEVIGLTKNSGTDGGESDDQS